MREAGGQGGGRLNMMPTIIGKQDADDDADNAADDDADDDADNDADDDADDDADKDKHHTPRFS